MHNWYGGFCSLSKRYLGFKKGQNWYIFFINDKTDTYTFQVYQFDIFIHLWFKNLTKFLPVYKNQSKTKNMLPHVQNATSAWHLIKKEKEKEKYKDPYLGVGGPKVFITQVAFT
jgi:hypothetical protein